MPRNLILYTYNVDCQLVTPPRRMSADFFVGLYIYIYIFVYINTKSGLHTWFASVRCASVNASDLHVMNALPKDPSAHDTVVTVRGILQPSTTPIAAQPPWTFGSWTSALSISLSCMGSVKSRFKTRSMQCLIFFRAVDRESSSTRGRCCKFLARGRYCKLQT